MFLLESAPADKTLYSWGFNRQEQVDDLNRIRSLVPTRIGIQQRNKSHEFRKVLGLQQAEGSLSNDLNTALAVCTLLNYQYGDRLVLEQSIHKNLERQGENGAWSRNPLSSATPAIVWEEKLALGQWVFGVRKN